MVDEQSFLFDFSHVDNFMTQWNLAFKLSDMNSSNNFELVFCTDSPNNVRECLTSGGAIDTNNVTIATDGVVPCSLKWENNTISLRNDATWNIDGEIPLKSIFLRVANNGYVMAYCINISEFNCTNKLTFEGGVAFWRIIDE